MEKWDGILNQCRVAGLRLVGAQWVEPTLSAKVRRLAGGKYLRHAVVKTLE